LRSDGYSELQNIRCPTLIVASSDDQLSSLAEAQLMAAQIPAASLVLIEDCGHMTPLEKPRQLLQILSDWLLPITSTTAINALDRPIQRA
jgi:pimeloyl-ACP methyl ester carboxylesterase